MDLVIDFIMKSRVLKKSFTYFTLLVMTGCASIGPKQVHIDRGTYNNMVRQTDQEQLLTNIIRLRYLEVTQYIQVTNLTASYSLSQSVAGSVSATTGSSPASWVYSISPTVSYSDTPTISYAPLSDIVFAKSLMTPILMNDYILLTHAGGFDYSVLFLLFFEQIGSVNSILLNIDGVNKRTEDYVKFVEIIRLLDICYKHDHFEVPEAVSYENRVGILFTFRPHKEKSRDALKLKKLLEIPASAKEIVFMEHTLLKELTKKNDLVGLSKDKTKPKNVVLVRLRSAYSIMYSLGRGVQIPEDDIKGQLTRELINSDGSVHDWAAWKKHVFKVYSCDKEPKDDYLVKVFVHNHWFYIKASDKISKTTFAAVMRLVTLTSAVSDGGNSAPVLTIPVSAG